MTATLEFRDGDMVSQPNNRGYSFIEGADKLYQDVGLMLTSDVRKSTGLGCALDSSIGTDTMQHTEGYGNIPAVFDFQQRIKRGLSRFQNYQRSSQLGQRTPTELMFDFSSARVWYGSSDPRSFSWEILVTPEQGSNFNLGGATGA